MYPMLINILISTMVQFVIKIKNYILRFWSMKVVTIKNGIFYSLLHTHTHILNNTILHTNTIIHTQTL